MGLAKIHDLSRNQQSHLCACLDFSLLCRLELKKKVWSLIGRIIKQEWNFSCRLEVRAGRFNSCRSTTGMWLSLWWGKKGSTSPKLPIHSFPALPLPWQPQVCSLCFISSVQLLSCVRLFATPWIAARQASLSITNSRSSLRLTSIESVMPSSHLILCRPLLLLPPIPPSISLFQWVNSLHEVAKVLEFQL